MTPLWVMFRKDLRLVYRDPMAFGLLLLTPFLLIAIVSEAFKPLFEGAVAFEVPVVDLDRSAESERLLGELDELRAIDLERRDWDGEEFDEADAAALFDGRGREFAALVIPKGLGESLNSDGEASVIFYADPVQAGFSNIVLDQISDRLAVDGLVRSFAAALAAETGSSEEEARQALEGEGGGAGLEVQAAFVSDRKALPSHFEQTVPGFAVMFTFWLSIFVAASIFVEKRQYHTWRRTLVAPVPRAWIVLSRVLAYVVVGLAQLTILFALGWALFGMHLGDDIAALWLVLAVMALVTTGFGILMASLIKDFTTLNSVMNLVVIALAAIGGALVPIVFLPGWVQVVSPLTPHYWAMDAIQRLIILGDGLTDVVVQIGVLLAFAAGFFTLGLWRFRYTD